MSAYGQIDAVNFSTGYPGNTVIRDLNFTIPRGQSVVIVGPNGAGKSTLFKALVGILPVVQGDLRIDGNPVGSHVDCVAYIPQRSEIESRFPVTVRDVVTMGRYGKRGWFSPIAEKDRSIVAESLERMDIQALSGKPYAELSGGQQQRVLLARALAQRPHILLLDEPFNGIDTNTLQIMLDLLANFKQHEVTVLISTHDLSLAARHFSRVFLLKNQLVADGDPESVFTPENLHRAYGNQIFSIGDHILSEACCQDDEEVPA